MTFNLDFTAKGQQIYARSKETVSYATQLESSDVSNSPGVVSMLTALFGCYILVMIGSRRHDRRTQAKRYDELWLDAQIQMHIVTAVESDPFMDQNVIYSTDSRTTNTPLENAVVETLRPFQPRSESGRTTSKGSFQALQTKKRSTSMLGDWVDGLRTKHRVLSLFATDNYAYLSNRQKLTLVFCQVSE